MLRPVHLCTLVVALALAGCPTPDPELPAVEDPVAYADPLIGSGGWGFNYAACYPGAAAPNGLAKVGPDTTGRWGLADFVHYSGYWYDDDTIQSFTHLHVHGTGVPDMGVLAVLPVATFNPAWRDVALYQSKFDKASEHAAPGYYTATLDSTGAKVEIAATMHGAHHRWTWPSGATTGRVMLDLSKHLGRGSVKDLALTLLPAEKRITGHLHNMGGMSGNHGGTLIHFDLRTARPWSKALVWSPGEAPSEGLSAAGDDGVGALLEFDLADGKPLEFQVSLSIVDPAGAERNFTAELAGKSFDEVKAATQQLWREVLGRVRLSGGTDDERRNFYSSLYHAHVMPTVYSDVDGRYRGADKQVHVAEGFRFVSDLSLWDTYRTLHPLYSLVQPREAWDSVRSLVEFAKIGGFPRWPLADGETGTMLGAPADIVIADAYVKGVPGDYAEAWTLLRGAALAPEWELRGARGDGWGEYAASGFFPGFDGRYVSKTIEYAHADFALSEMAAALARKADGPDRGALEADARALRSRSRGWRRHYDPARGFLLPLLPDGSFAPLDEGWAPEAWWRYYAEASAWQTLWGAPHDIEAYPELMGGTARAVERLEEFFQKARDEWVDAAERDPVELWTLPRGWYFHPNEPSIHIAWMFAQLGRPDLTQKWLAWIVPTFYRPTPDGRPGNDDGGAMGAWWVFTAMGFYPVPGSEYYVLGAPFLPKVELRVGDGVFTVLAPGASAENRYVQSATLDGRELESAMILHSDLKPGSVLRFRMGPKPGNWAVRR
jgi:predicted alpha-1,2-mannosidase